MPTPPTTTMSPSRKYQPAYSFSLYAPLATTTDLFGCRCPNPPPPPKPPLPRDFLQMAETVTDISASLRPLHIQHLLRKQPNVPPMDVLLQVLNDRENILVHKRDRARLNGLVANRQRWTTHWKDIPECWSPFHRRCQFPIRNIKEFLFHEVRHGAVRMIASWDIHNPPPQERRPQPPKWRSRPFRWLLDSYATAGASEKETHCAQCLCRGTYIVSPHCQGIHLDTSLVASLSQEYRQTCCQGCSQACSQACSWRAHSNGSC